MQIRRIYLLLFAGSVVSCSWIIPAYGDCSRPTTLNLNVIITPDQPSYSTWYAFVASCPAGYTQAGPTGNIYCTSGSPDYWNPDPSSASCSAPCLRPALTDTSVIITPNTTVYNPGEVVSFSCSSGDIVGPTTSTCQGDENWDYLNEPSCPAGCDVPANTDGTGPYNHGDGETFACDPDYALQGGGDSIASTCNAGDWNPLVICKLIAQCPRPSLGNSDIIFSPNQTSYSPGKIITFSCHVGTLQGLPSTTCQDNGNWTYPFKPSCVVAATYCVAPANTNGTGTYSTATTETFQCDSGFALPNGQDIIETTCITGTWNPPTDCQSSEVRVLCDSSSMTVLLGKGFVGNGSRAGDVHFDDETCVGYNHDQNHIALSTTYNLCLTKFEKNNNTIIYSNVVTYYTPQPINNSDITRETVLKIPVRCELERHRLLGSFFSPKMGVVSFTEEGYGNYSISLDRYPDQTFGQPVVDKGAEVTLGEHLYFAVNLNSVAGLVVFIENCWATPSSYPSDATTYSFLENGCPEDPTMQILSNYNSSLQTFEIDAFAFIEENAQVFIHCEVLVCDNGLSSRCAQGCQPRVRRGGRQTRGTSSIPRLISNGPYTARRDDILMLKNNESGARTMGLTSVLLIGGGVGMACLITGMAAMFIYLRSSHRVSHRGYRRVADEDDCD